MLTKNKRWMLFKIDKKSDPNLCQIFKRSAARCPCNMDKVEVSYQSVMVHNSDTCFFVAVKNCWSKFNVDSIFP